MRNTIKLATLCLTWAMLIMITACIYNSKHQKQNNMTIAEKNGIFSKGDPAPGIYFTGDAFIHPLLPKDKNNEFALGSVTFEPGARTIWHTHPKGQVLIVTEGEGFYQERGKPARPLQKGDVVNIPEHVEHWHGANAHNKLVHIAITNYKGGENVVWLKPVTDQEYQEANNQ